MTRPGRSAPAVLAALPGAAAHATPPLPTLYAAPPPTRASAGVVPHPHGVAMLPDVTYASIPGYRPLKLDL